MYYLIAKHEQNDGVVALPEEEVKHLAQFIRYLEHMHEGKCLTSSVLNQKKLNYFTNVIYANSEEEFEAVIRRTL